MKQVEGQLEGWVGLLAWEVVLSSLGCEEG